MGRRKYIIKIKRKVDQRKVAYSYPNSFLPKTALVSDMLTQYGREKGGRVFSKINTITNRSTVLHMQARSSLLSSLSFFSLSLSLSLSLSIHIYIPVPGVKKKKNMAIHVMPRALAIAVLHGV